MQAQIAVPRDGIVKAVLVRPGEQVDAKDLLLELEYASRAHRFGCHGPAREKKAPDNAKPIKPGSKRDTKATISRGDPNPHINQRR
jgi:pyruvate/2-oxoglutarate dehydrogenase complex dihydrolipoamide acyltransferase (E2) component